MIDPTNTLGTKLHRDAKKYEALKADLERDAAKLALWDEMARELEIAFTIFDTVGARLSCDKMKPVLDRMRELQK